VYLQDLTYLRTLQTPLHTVLSAAFLPESELLALGGYSSTVVVRVFVAAAAEQQPNITIARCEQARADALAVGG